MLFFHVLNSNFLSCNIYKIFAESQLKYHGTEGFLFSVFRMSKLEKLTKLVIISLCVSTYS